jgi:acyl carrier protein
MDVLNFVAALHEELGIDVPEQDYPKIDTLEGCIDHIAAAIAAREKNHRVGGPR